MADAGLFLSCYIAMVAIAAGLYRVILERKTAMKLFTDWRYWTVIVAIVIGVLVGTAATQSAGAATSPRCAGKALVLCGTPKPPPAPVRKAPVFKAPAHYQK